MIFNPIHTYRVQFHKDFTFRNLKNIIPYLQQLGVKTIYASPIFSAAPGSGHGYDCIDPNTINPEIGTLEELREIAAILADAGMFWLQDIVPNHMAFHPGNKWLMDVLEKGKASEFASFFDIDFYAPGNEKLMVPFIDKPIEEAIESGDLKLVKVDGKIMVAHFDNHYPLSAESIAGFDDNNDAPALSRPDMLALLQAQHYRFCHWQETDERINYRRFFIVNNLICLNIQHQHVFDQHHRLVKQLLAEGIFHGLRIDHIDGLYNPEEYLQRLRKLAGEETYIVVEKILEPGEKLPSTWPVQGTTGYDFLSMTNHLLLNQKAEQPLTNFYRHLTGNATHIENQVHQKKALILREHMQGELHNLYQLFLHSAGTAATPVPEKEMKEAIATFLIFCPVYRFYGQSFPLPPEEEKAVKDVFQTIADKNHYSEGLKVLYGFLLPKYNDDGNHEDSNRSAFYRRCMQFTGPLMAKGVEDTLMYSNNSFMGHNEVGDSPALLGKTAGVFHKQMQWRLQHWPLAMNASATHDTKRGEDSRARLQVLTDMAEQWIATVKEWQELNRELKQDNHPDENDEYLVYQALIAAYPMPGQDEDNIGERLQAYLEKALREAKTHSNWTNPDDHYEEKVKAFALGLLDKQRPFWQSFQNFHAAIADHGIINSLTSLVLKFTCPGMPDVYQGTEYWDLSFVDPDNRRPVDYEVRQELLQHLEKKKKKKTLAHAWQHRYNGNIKLWLMQQLLQLRLKHPAIFSEGEYQPLQVEGEYKDHVLAIMRRHQDDAFIIVLPLNTAAISTPGASPFDINWLNTRVVLPENLRPEIKNIFTKNKTSAQKFLPVQELFEKFPAAILKAGLVRNQRSAGILMHITSLPSKFGVGDMGPAAIAFADFLYRSGQKYWQLLPLNPTESGQSYSPYSALSSMAGYPLLISPDLLADDGLLTADDLLPHELPLTTMVDYAAAEKTKYSLLEKAFHNFSTLGASPMHYRFKKYCAQEEGWLNDFALFIYIKQQQQGKPWYEWPEELKLRDKKALEALADNGEDELKKIKWFQFIFSKQWQQLRNYCNTKGIQLVGDIPFYVSYDSADVWSNTKIFSLDEEGRRIGVAGVPPDSFSADGQLWGMPVFKWDVLEKTHFAWWIERLKKNIALFDLVRLDHFRAFADYWEVAANEATAQNGHWKSGPGKAFFKALKKAFGRLPLIAEDLGAINDDVLKLRDDFNLPGMKVLQFAFSDDMPRSGYIPHNYDKNFIVYTGTHDNNTTVGWYRTQVNEAEQNRMSLYFGSTITEKNVHRHFIRLAYSSVANTAIIPLQDVLGLDETGRMNTPSTNANNWTWRLLPDALQDNVEGYLKEMVIRYNRV